MATGALTMLFLTMSGTVLIARRVGGWRRFFEPLQGSLAGRLHVEIARVSVLGLVLSSTTALWMAASTFDLLVIESSKPTVPAMVSGKSDVALGAIELLGRIAVSELRELSFPYPAMQTTSSH
jgi:sulfite reductase (NADPH) flavoprotein alpha-component